MYTYIIQAYMYTYMYYINIKIYVIIYYIYIIIYVLYVCVCLCIVYILLSKLSTKTMQLQKDQTFPRKQGFSRGFQPHEHSQFRQAKRILKTVNINDIIHAFPRSIFAQIHISQIPIAFPSANFYFFQKFFRH